MILDTEALKSGLLELEKRILPTFNKLLEKKQFFCGSELTVFDIQIYSEITSIAALTQEHTIIKRSQLSNLSAWMDLMQVIAEFRVEGESHKKRVQKVLPPKFN